MQDSRRERGGETACTYTNADVRGKHRLEISFSPESSMCVVFACRVAGDISAMCSFVKGELGSMAKPR